MTRDDIIRMAREAGLIHFYDSEGHCTGVTDEPLITAEKDKNDERLVEILEPFADLVAAAVRNQTWTRKHWTDYERAIEAAEREACARLCELKSVSEYFDRPQTPMDCANAIRARGQA